MNKNDIVLVDGIINREVNKTIDNIISKVQLISDNAIIKEIVLEILEQAKRDY